MLSALALMLATACSDSSDVVAPYGASAARIGETQSVLGWNMAVANLRWEGNYVLIDVDAAPSESGAAHASAGDVRFGLYGTVAHPVEATGIGSCARVNSLVMTPLSAPNPDRLTGSVCIGPIAQQSAVRGVYAYSPRERIAGTVAAYPAAFPLGVLPTNSNDTGLVVTTSSVEAWRANGTPLSELSLGDPRVFAGNGYMLLGVEIDAVAAKYRDDSQRRGGPMMVLAAPSQPGFGGNPACAAYGSSVLVMPDALLDAVRVSASLCTQGEINAAVLYATVSVVGTHAAVWTTRD